MESMNTMAPALDVRELEKLRELDLEEARAIQGAMLPEEALQTEHVSISHEFQPVTEVGGDFLDYFELADGTFGLYLGDVSGKGLPATLYAALAVGTLRGVHKTGQAPLQVLTTLNRRLMIRGVPRRYTALQYAVFDPATREMKISSAGMPGPFHISGTGCKALELSGIPPGLFSNACYDMTSVLLQPGDSMLFCTDGITDAMDTEGESIGIDKLVAICGEWAGAKPKEFLSALFSAVESFSRGTAQHDDMAAAFFHYSG
jgi:sigma-B regulation protein RsbU (phosphoserine phosphatase)